MVAANGAHPASLSIAPVSAPAADSLATISDLASTRDIAATIRESAEHVLRVALAREGLIASPEKIARLAKEIGNNAAFCVGFMAVEVQS